MLLFTNLIYEQMQLFQLLYVIVNDDLDAAVAEAKAIILAARAERKDMCGLAGFIEQVVENQ